MSQFFGKVKTKLDLNGPSLEFSTQPVSVATTGVGIGSTGGPDVTLSGIATVGFINSPDSPPPCIAVIDENTGSSQSSVDQDWINFYAAHPNRKFNLMDVSDGGAVGVPTSSLSGVVGNFRKFDVNRDNGFVANQSDWFALAGIATGQGYSVVTLWVDSSGSMTPANVQASLDLFLTNCSNAGITVTQSPDPNAYFEEYIEPFITELTGPPSPTNKGSIGYQWYESGLGKLVEGDKYVGTASTTLTIKNIITPTDNDKKYYLEADYIPGQPGARTGNALNEPLNSGIATVTVTPVIDINVQPSSAARIQNIDATFSVSAQLTNGATGGISYQWQLDEENITDGDISYNTGGGSTSYNQTLVDGGSFVIPADATDVKLDLAAGPGGDGGIGSPPGDYGTGGEGGGGKTAWFSIPNAGGKVVRFHKGYRGQDGVNGGSGAAGAAAGGDTGTNTNFGASEGNLGGGGGGATTIRIDSAGGNPLIAIALGGGGGGGASGRTFQNPNNGQNGVDANTAFVQNTNGNIPLSAGGTGEGSAGSGGGGGGSGVTGANGGDEGVTIGLGGQGGVNTFDPNQVTLIGSSLNPSFTNSDGWGEINYTSASATPPTSQNITVSGTQTPTLTIRSDSVLTRRIRCVVSHTSEDIPDVISDSVNFICQSSTDTSNVSIEAIGTTSTATLTEHDLNDGEYTFDMIPLSTTSTVLYYCLYSPDKDVDIEMDLYGGKGTDTEFHSGGEGGYSRIRFTLEKDTEYIISGLNEIINTPFIYRKSTLMACVGQGGHAGPGGAGGDGGGTNISGFTGQGFGSGAGGVTPGLIPQSNGLSGQDLTTSGIYGSGFTSTDPNSIYYYTPQTYPQDTQASGDNGGLTISCPKGVYFAEYGGQGIPGVSSPLSPCSDIPGDTRFRLSDGTIVDNTAQISRGYKAGYDIIQTAGGSEGQGVTGRSGRPGRGGNGATGGAGGTFQNSPPGGGGGSGYQDGSVTVVDQQQGGSTGNSKVVIRLAIGTPSEVFYSP